MNSAERKKLHRAALYADLLARALHELADAFPDDEQGPSGPGRPLIEPTEVQREEVLWLATSNGRLGVRAIGERVGLSWRVVQRILDEDLPSHKPPKTSQNSTRRGS